MENENNAICSRCGRSLWIHPEMAFDEIIHEGVCDRFMTEEQKTQRDRVIEEAKEYLSLHYMNPADMRFDSDVMADFALLQYEAGERAATARMINELRELDAFSFNETYRTEVEKYIEKLEEAAKTK